MCLSQSVSVSISPYGPSAGARRIQVVTWTTTRSGVPKEAGTATGPHRWSLRSPTGHRACLGTCGGIQEEVGRPKTLPPPPPQHTALSGYILPHLQVDSAIHRARGQLPGPPPSGGDTPRSPAPALSADKRCLQDEGWKMQQFYLVGQERIRLCEATRTQANVS